LNGDILKMAQENEKPVPMLTVAINDWRPNKKGQRIRSPYVILAQAVAGSGIFKLRFGQRTMGEYLEKAISAVITIGSRILHPWHNTWLWNTLRVLIPPAPLRLLVLDTYEPETTHLFRQLLRPGMTVVDTGAFIGHYTILSALEVGDSGHVYAFEPDPRILPKLKHNVRLSGCQDRVTIIPAAVSNKTGEGQLFSGEEEGWLTVYPRAVDHRSVQIEVTSLDTYFGALGWPTVNLMKMDIDGAEIWALEGMVELSRRNPHLKLVIEFAPYHIREAGGTPGQFFETLQRVGFSRFFTISKELRRLVIPRDLAWLVEKAEQMTVNLLCKRNAS